MNVAGSKQCLFSCVAIAAVLLLLPQAASAKKEKRDKKSGSPESVDACVDKYKSGLENEQAGHLKQARELFIRCAKASCGSPLRDECTTRFTQLSTDIPSIVPVVTDDAGNPQTDVEVRVDGERLTSSLDGHSFLLDPGVREFSFSREGRVFATQRLMIVQGQRNRLVSASTQPAAETTTKRPAKVKKPAASVAVAAATEAAPPPPPAEPVEAKVAPHEPDLTPHAKTEPAEDRRAAAQPRDRGDGELGRRPQADLCLERDRRGRSRRGRPADLLGPQGQRQAGRVQHARRPTARTRRSTTSTTCTWAPTSPSASGWPRWPAPTGPTRTTAPRNPQSHEAYRFDVQPTKSGAVASIGGSF